MKHILILTAALLCPVFAGAKEPTALELPPDWFNFYFQPEFHFSEASEDHAEMAGVEIGVSLNERWDFGLNWRSLINDLDLNKAGVEDPGAGDLMTLAASVGFHLAPCNMLDATLRLDVGGGILEVGDDESEIDFMLVEPSIDLGLNLTDTLVFGASLGYRWLDGSDSDLLQDKDLESLTGAVFLRFDEF